MAFCVYIIQSEADGSYYKGFSENPLKRLSQHNNGEATYTSSKIPWILVYVEELATKREALIRERSFKKYSHFQIQKILMNGKNIVDQFGSPAG